MAKTSTQLEREIATNLGRKVGLPRWNDRKGWVGGDSKTLYAFTDKRTGQVTVHMGGYRGTKGDIQVHVGPEATVRMATRAEAERLWQSPLHSGWNVAP